METALRTTQSTAVHVRNLRMRYGDHEVLRGIDFDIRHGEIVCLLGPNGAGKTTCIEILQGFRGRSAGDVELLGTDPAAGDEDWRARIGVVLQSWRDHARWTPYQLLSHLGAFYRPYSTANSPRPLDAAELLETVGLTAQAEQQIGTLSGGQRRRMDVAIGIIGAPELLFLDEPTAPFDPHARRDFHDLVRTISAEKETTILLTTHDLDEAERLADRILILVDGQIVADGTPAELSHGLGSGTTVSWHLNGVRHQQHVQDATAFARELFLAHGEEVEDLGIHHTSLEDTYLAMIGHSSAANEMNNGDPQ